ncbi:MAG: hypothetical protein HKN05_12020, partial [Rhizobiales bacterium]|nr:hypothetical protein [Hyphomicrobiales bacterium]
MARVDTSQAPDGNPRRPETDQAARVMERYFTVRGNELCVGGIPVSDLVDTFGSPHFVYDQTIIRQKIAEVQEILPERFDLFYSIKANPNGHILKSFLTEGCGLEVASAGELFQA